MSAYFRKLLLPQRHTLLVVLYSLVTVISTLTGTVMVVAPM
jgi:hypothetical protein